MEQTAPLDNKCSLKQRELTTTAKSFLPDEFSVGVSVGEGDADGERKRGRKGEK